MRTNATATIYNKYIVNKKEKYQRTVIGSVFWENKRAAEGIRSALLSADQATIYIPFGLGANYKDPIAWNKLADKTGYWTLQIGDVIVKGAVTKEIADAVEGSIDPPVEPVPAYTMTNLRADYDDVFTIHSIDMCDYGSFAIRHWQVGAE